MALFDFSGGSKKDSLSLVKKTKTKPKSTSQNTLDDAIRRVESALGDYKDKYQFIVEENELHSLIDKVIEDGICAIDTETTGLNIYKEEIVGVSIYSKSIKASYIPINHISLYTKERISNQLSKDIVSREFGRLKDVKIIWHNYHFDYKVFKLKLNIDLPIYRDTLVGAHLLNENEEHGLKYLYKKYIENTEEGVFKFSSLFDELKFNVIPIKVGFIYASHDAYMTYKLYEYQLKEFSKKDNETVFKCFRDIEIPILRPTLDMELRGIEISTTYTEELSREYNKKLDEARQLYYNELKNYQKDIDQYRKLNPDKLDDPVNYASPSQMAILFYDIIKVKPVSEKTPRGTGEEILKAINLPICDRILECRGYEKLIGTYIDKLPKTRWADNAIHTNFNTCGTVTGRFSSSDPNLQNIPSHDKYIRKMFTARDGYVLIGGDYSQQEVRILAHLTQDESLINAYKEGKDIYSWFASITYNLPYEDCLEFRPDGSTNYEAKERRGHLKAIVLGRHICSSKTM